MHKDLAVSQAITKWFNFVCDAQGKIVICHRYANAVPLPQQFDQFGNVDSRADIEVRLVKTAEEFKDLASSPGCDIQIMCHDKELVWLTRVAQQARGRYRTGSGSDPVRPFKIESLRPRTLKCYVSILLR